MSKDLLRKGNTAVSLIEHLRQTLLRSRDVTRSCAAHCPLTWNKLRIDRNDGSLVEEYRIENGKVHRRRIDTTAEASTALQGQWERVTPGELTSHMTAKTVLAYWLSHKLGPDTLSRACAQNRSSASDVVAERQQLPRGMARMFGSLEPITE